MTPLTHAAVGTVICQQVRKLRWGVAGWLVALSLAFFSHYLLDAIPHFEGMSPIEDYKQSLAIALGLGAAGVLPALLLMHKNREAGRIWLVLFLWIGLGLFSWSWWRLATATLALAYIGWKSPHRKAVYYAAAGILAVLPDLFPPSFQTMAAFHQRMHYKRDWATQIYLHFAHAPLPFGWHRLHDPYFLLGYSLEILVEGAIFCGAIYLFSREEFFPEKNAPAHITEDLELSGKIGRGSI